MARLRANSESTANVHRVVYAGAQVGKRTDRIPRREVSFVVLRHLRHRRIGSVADGPAIRSASVV